MMCSETRWLQSNDTKVKGQVKKNGLQKIEVIITSTLPTKLLFLLNLLSSMLESTVNHEAF